MDLVHPLFKLLSRSIAHVNGTVDYNVFNELKRSPGNIDMNESLVSNKMMGDCYKNLVENYDIGK